MRYSNAGEGDVCLPMAYKERGTGRVDPRKLVSEKGATSRRRGRGKRRKGYEKVLIIREARMVQGRVKSK